MVGVFVLNCAYVQNLVAVPGGGLFGVYRVIGPVWALGDCACLYNKREMHYAVVKGIKSRIVPTCQRGVFVT